MNVNKFKLVLSIFFLVFGLACAVLTYELKTSYTFTRTRDYGGYTNYGVDSANNGVAVGLGIISGFSFLSSVLLLNSLKE